MKLPEKEKTMTDRIKSLLDRTFDKEQAKFRRDVDWKPLLDRFIAEKTDDETRARVGLVKLLDTDFAGRPDVLAAAKAAPKMGNADARVDALAKRLVDFWGHAFDGQRNDRGGIFRPGTGSAMYYVWHAREVPASADGRLKASRSRRTTRRPSTRPSRAPSRSSAPSRSRTSCRSATAGR